VKISQVILHNPANKQTNRQTNANENKTSLAEANIHMEKGLSVSYASHMLMTFDTGHKPSWRWRGFYQCDYSTHHYGFHRAINPTE